MEVPPEITLSLLGWLDPLSQKRYGAVSKNHREVILEYTVTDDCGREYVAGAIAALEQLLLTAHGECVAIHPALRADVHSHAIHVASILSGSSKHPSLWSRTEVLAFLWPVAIHCREVWPSATHALEWCARHGERTPRREILALFDRDAMRQLVGIARARGWEAGLSCATVAAVACRTACRPMLPSLTAAIELVVKEAITCARAPGDLLFCVAVRAASRAVMPDYSGSARPLPIALLSRSLFVLSRRFQDWSHPVDRQWLIMAGLTDDTERNPLVMLRAFVCKCAIPVPHHQYSLGEMLDIAQNVNQGGQRRGDIGTFGGGVNDQLSDIMWHFGENLAHEGDTSDASDVSEP